MIIAAAVTILPVRSPLEIRALARRHREGPHWSCSPTWTARPSVTTCLPGLAGASSRSTGGPTSARPSAPSTRRSTWSAGLIWPMLWSRPDRSAVIPRWPPRSSTSIPPPRRWCAPTSASATTSRPWPSSSNGPRGQHRWAASQTATRRCWRICGPPCSIALAWVSPVSWQPWRQHGRTTWCRSGWRWG